MRRRLTKAVTTVRMAVMMAVMMVKMVMRRLDGEPGIHPEFTQMLLLLINQ